jgi:hypothetical protein
MLLKHTRNQLLQDAAPMGWLLADVLGYNKLQIFVATNIYAFLAFTRFA